MTRDGSSQGWMSSTGRLMKAVVPSSSPSQVTCSSPDSTVKTEIPADLRFPDFADLGFPDFNDIASIIGHDQETNGSEQCNGMLAKVDSSGMVSLESPVVEFHVTSDGTVLAPLQPLQHVQTSSLSSSCSDNPQPIYSPLPSTPEGSLSSSSPTWVSNSTPPPILPQKPTWPSPRENGGVHGGPSQIQLSQMSAVTSTKHHPSSGSHLKDLLLNGTSAIYQRRAPTDNNTLLQLLKQNPSTADPVRVCTAQLAYNGFGSSKDKNGASLPSTTYRGVTYSPLGSTSPKYHPRTSSLNVSPTSTSPISSSTKSSPPPVYGPGSSGEASSIDALITTSRFGKVSSSKAKRTRTPAIKKEGRLHPCTVCNKSFKDRFSLEAHFRIHTGERPFKCGICGKGFKQKAHMQKHATMHLGPGRLGQVRQPSRRIPREYNRNGPNGGTNVGGGGGPENKKKKTLKKPTNNNNNGGVAKDANYNHVNYSEFSDPSVSTTTLEVDELPQEKSATDFGGELYRRLTSNGSLSKSDGNGFGDAIDKLSYDFPASDLKGSFTLPADCLSTIETDKSSSFNDVRISLVDPFSSKEALDEFEYGINIKDVFEDVDSKGNSAEVSPEHTPPSLQDRVQVLQNSDGSEVTYRLADTPFNNNDTAKKMSVTYMRGSADLMAESSKGGATFRCTICRAVVSRDDQLEHSEVHWKQNGLVKMEPEAYEVYPCLTCGKDFPRQDYDIHRCTLVN